MNRQEHLLTILAEECAEIQQGVAKILRFGLLDSYNGGVTNYERLMQEYNDLLGVAQLLSKEGIPLVADADMQEAKCAKVERYMEVSRNCGTLNE